MIKNKKVVEGIKMVFYYVVVPFVTMWVCVNFIITPIGVSGVSMAPNVHDGDFALIDIIGYKLTGLKRFDTVVFYSEEDERYIIKRVIGLPGEHIEHIDDKLYVNGEYIEQPFLDEAYMKEQKNQLHINQFTKDFEVYLKEDEYFVLGDNRPSSKDSIMIGPINSNQIIGKNGIILYPFNYFLRGVRDY